MRPSLRAFFVISLVALSGCLTGYIIAHQHLIQPCPPVILRTLTGTFTDKNEKDQLVLVEPDSHDLRKNFIAISRIRGNTLVPTWRSPVVPAWDIRLADVDGDGRNELALCLYKTELHDPKKDNRLQIYAWGKNGIYAKWRGTFLCYPYQRLTFADLDHDGRAELISLEHYQERQFLSVYRWNGFGFDLLAQVRLQSPMASVECSGNRIRLCSVDGKKVLSFQLNKATLEEQEG